MNKNLNPVHGVTDTDPPVMDPKGLEQRILARIEELPRASAILSQLLSADSVSSGGAGELIDILSQDQAITARILKIVNSAYYGFSREITGLGRAVSLLGSPLVRSLGLSLAVMDMMPSIEDTPWLSREGIWLHSLAVAVVIKEMGRNSNLKRQTDRLFLIGMLHDTGKILLHRFFPEDFQTALTQSHGHNARILHEVVLDLLGMDHGQIAGILLRRCGFPPSVIIPIEGHHSYSSADMEMNIDTAFLRIANSLAQELGFGREGNSLYNHILPSDMEMLSLTAYDLSAYRAYLQTSRDGLYAFLAALLSG